MPAITKESMPASSTEPKAGTQKPGRTDAVGVEIPVVVHASRNSVAVREIAKPQTPVHEETRTVIVFPQGAVVRLTAAMTAGELVVLTNQRSGADVLCRVASVKAQPGIQNYVDLEFTQRAPGFWGDCFPSEPLHASPAAELPSLRANNSFVPSQNKPVPAQMVSAPIVSATPPSAPPVSVPPMAAASITSVPVTAAPVLPTRAPQPAPPITFSTLPAMRLEPQPQAEPFAAPVPLTASENNLSTGSRHVADLGQLQSLDAGPAERAANGSRKIVLMAIAAVVLSAILGGTMMLRKGSATPSASQPSAVTQSLPATPAAISRPPAAAPQRAVVAPAKPELAAAPPLPPADSVVTKSSEELLKSAPLPKPPSRKSVALVVGKLSAPVSKKPVSISASEAPPVLPASAIPGAAGTSLLLSSEPGSGPVSPATVARNTTLVGGRVLEPKLISSASPTYPAQANLQRVQGDVVVDALVDARGRVTEAKAVSGSPLLQQAAINAVRTWRYEPARLDGEPVPAHMQVRISFHLP